MECAACSPLHKLSLLTEMSFKLSCRSSVSSLAKATLVDQLPHCLQGGIAIGDIRLHKFQHVQDRLVDLSSVAVNLQVLKSNATAVCLQKDSIVQLLQPQKLQHLPAKIFRMD